MDRADFFLILALGFASTHGGAAESTLVQVGYGGIAGYQLPLWVNKDHGISKNTASSSSRS